MCGCGRERAWIINQHLGGRDGAFAPEPRNGGPRAVVAALKDKNPGKLQEAAYLAWNPDMCHKRMRRFANANETKC